MLCCFVLFLKRFSLPNNRMKLLLALGVVTGALLALPVAAQTMGDTKSGGKAALCIGCHSIPGYKMAYPTTYSVPLIAGQQAKYLENALQAYKKGERKHPTMVAIASSLSDKDMAELATYYAGGAK